MKKTKILSMIFTFFVMLNNNFVLATSEGKLNVEEKGLDKIFFLVIGIVLLGLVLFFGYKMDDDNNESGTSKTKSKGNKVSQKPRENIANTMQDMPYQREPNEVYKEEKVEPYAIPEEYEEDDNEEESLFSIKTSSKKDVASNNSFDSTMVFDTRRLDKDEYKSEEDEDLNLDEEETYISDEDEDFNLEDEDEEETYISDEDDNFNLENEDEEETYISDEDEDFSLEDEEENVEEIISKEENNFNTVEKKEEKDDFLKELEKFEEEAEEFTGFTTISSSKKTSNKKVEEPVPKIEEEKEKEEYITEFNSNSSEDLGKAFLEEMNKNLIKNKKLSGEEKVKVAKTTTKKSSTTKAKKSEDDKKETKTTRKNTKK